MKGAVNILTNDPSFTAWGWAVINEVNQVIDSGCIKTEPEQKKRRIRVSDDRTRRVQVIIDHLLNLVDEYKIDLILTEMPHGSQNANAAIMIGMVTGVIVTIAQCRDIPLEQYSEQDAKKCLLGKKAATKDDTIEAIDRLYEVDWTKTKYIDEAVADALAVYHVAREQSQLLKMLLRR